MYVLTIKPVGHAVIEIDLTNVIGANHSDVISNKIAHLPSGTEMVFSHWINNHIRSLSWEETRYRN